MAKINYVKKSRKEQKCGSCSKIIPVGSEYQWISFNFGPTHVRCQRCGFKPYETTANEYGKSAGRIVYDFEQAVENANFIEEIESAKDNVVSELESLRDELEDRKDNLPEQFQESGPGEIITERIDNLEEVINELESIDFDFDVEEMSEDMSIEDMFEVIRYEDGVDESWDYDQVLEKYSEYYQEKLDEKMEEIKSSLTDAIGNLMY